MLYFGLYSCAENAFFEAIRHQHPFTKEPNINDLDATLSVKEIRTSFGRLLDLCCPQSVAQYEEMDGKFMSHLEQTKWPSIVSKVLKLSDKIAKQVYLDGTVEVLQGTYT